MKAAWLLSWKVNAGRLAERAHTRRHTRPSRGGGAQDQRQRLARADLLPGETVTVSIGVSALQPGQSAEAWVKSADSALYRAKRNGRNQVMLAEAA